MSKLIGRRVKLVLPSTAMGVRDLTVDKHSVGEVLIVMRIDKISLPPFAVVCFRALGQRTIDRYAPIQLRYLNNRRVVL